MLLTKVSRSALMVSEHRDGDLLEILGEKSVCEKATIPAMIASVTSTIGEGIVEPEQNVLRRWE
jgi:hypothetical protein